MKRASLAVLGLLLGTAQASGSELSLVELEASVTRAFPTLIAAQADRDAASAELLAAKGAFDPTWRTRLDVSAFGYYENQRLDTYLDAPTPLWGTTFVAGYRLGVGNIPDYDGKYQTNSGGELRGGVKVPLLRDGYTDRRRVGIAKAKLGVELAGLSVAQQRLEVLRGARQRYWEWVASGRRLAVAEELLRVALERDSVIRARIDRGDLAAVEAVENARAIAQREAQRAMALRGVEQATIELSLYLRDERGRPVLVPQSRMPAQLADPEPAPELDQDLVGVHERRPEPRRLSVIRQQNAFELRLARNQLLPALDFSFVLSKDLGSGTASRGPLLGEVAVVLDVPLLLRAQRGKLAAVSAQARRIEAELGFAKDKAQAELRDAASAITAARARIEAARKENGLARELERLERQRFALGDSTLFVVNLREQSAIEAALREVDALTDYHKASAWYRAAAAR